MPVLELKPNGGSPGSMRDFERTSVQLVLRQDSEALAWFGSIEHTARMMGHWMGIDITSISQL